MSKEIDSLHLIAIAKRTETNDKRKKLIHRVRVSIRKLNADMFYKFIIEILHINHYKWLLEYNSVINQLMFYVNNYNGYRYNTNGFYLCNKVPLLQDFKEFFIRKIDNENYYVNCGAWWVITPEPPNLILHMVKYIIYNFWWLILLLIFIGFTLQ